MFVFSDYERLSPYGKVLGAEAGEELNQPCLAGWRLATIAVTAKELVSMSLHADSPEAFFPVDGACVLTLCLDDRFEQCDSFLLDRPILINAGVWHGLTVASGSAKLIVAENADVTLETKPYCDE